jgi:hypothetical protein
VSRDFSHPVFSHQTVPPGPSRQARNNFDFFLLVVELFDYFGATLVSMTPVKSIVLFKLDGPFEY